MKSLKQFATLTFLGLVSSLAVAAPDFGINNVLYLLVYVVIVGLIFYAIWYFIGWVGIPEPFNKIVRVIVGLAALLIVISLLLSFLGHPWMAHS